MHNLKRPFYIAIEGRDGTYKTTISKNLSAHFNAAWTEEPNNRLMMCRGIRSYCLQDKETITKVARELLFWASRSISLTNIIMPHLAKGESIISDRSFLSGMVYARHELGMSYQDWIWYAKELKFIPVWPDAIIYLVGDEIKIVKNENDRYDHESDLFHRNIEMYFNEAIEVTKAAIPSTRILCARVSKDKTEEENTLQTMLIVKEALCTKHEG